MKRQRTTTEVERAVFRHLDVLHKETKVGTRALQLKWGFDMDTCIFLIKLWNKNRNANSNVIGQYYTITL